MSTQDKDYNLIVASIEAVKGRISSLRNVPFVGIDPDTAIVYRCHGGGIFLTILADTTVDPTPEADMMAWLGTVVGSSGEFIGGTWGNTSHDCKVVAKDNVNAEIEDTPDSELKELFRLIFSTYKL